MMKKQLQISMSTFADFASKSGPAKATVVRQWKNKPPYSPALDFYKDIREALPDFCRKNITEERLAEIASEASSKKRSHYKEVLEGFRSWKEAKSGTWKEPVNADWTCGDVVIKTNPEIGYEEDGITYYVKLYFKSQKIKKYQADVYLELMASAFMLQRRKNSAVVVLDVKRGREYVARSSRPATNSLLKAEAAYWEILWDSL